MFFLVLLTFDCIKVMLLLMIMTNNIVNRNFLFSMYILVIKYLHN